MSWRATFVCFVALAGCAEARTDLVPVPLSSPRRDGGTADHDAAVGARCGDGVCKCADGEDNDRDGLIDGADPECTTPIDDEEGTFATDSPKGPLNDCEDCFWDDNASASDDGCSYPSACRADGPGAMAGPPGMTPASAMMCRSCEVAPRCVDSCRGSTPNGCDCFGCCAITGENGVAVHVVLSDECAVKHVDNPSKCPPCVPNPQCQNPCGPCELCFGKKPEDLPASCTDGGASEPPEVQCDDGYQACAEGDACPEGFFCVLGCCMVTVF
jgi:hypothetical protein